MPIDSAAACLDISGSDISCSAIEACSVRGRRWGLAAARKQNTGACIGEVESWSKPDFKFDEKSSRPCVGNLHSSEVNDDPRGQQRQVNIHARGRNTHSFDPETTMVRPAMRVLVGPSCTTRYGKSLRHDDVVLVPEFFCKEDDVSLYCRFVAELRELQHAGVKGSEWVSWHEGCHLISKSPEGSDLFRQVVDRAVDYFDILPETVVTRLNWYRDSADWKPFHHDSAAFNPQSAARADITVGISFGETRELAFLHAVNGTLAYFPQTNGMLFSFGRDVNIQWKHGINALPPDKREGYGRISVVVFGKLRHAIEESDSPTLLSNDGCKIEPALPAPKHGCSRNHICRFYRQGLCPAGDACQSRHS